MDGARTGSARTPERRSAISLQVFGVADGGEPIHRRLGSAWSLGPEDVERVRRALVLIADHERATAILDGLALDETAVALSQAAYEATGARPDVDFALASFARASRLPPDAAFSLFLLGRSVGWAAHIFEQIATGTLIRPRARYEGPELGK